MGKWTERFNVIASNVERNADEAVRQVTIGIVAALGRDTPVDTGRARNNWQTQIDSSALSYLDIPPAIPELGSSNAMQRARAVVSAYRSGQVVHITNNAPYIQRLNDGWSRQAPSNFVELAIVEAARMVANVRVLKNG